MGDEAHPMRDELENITRRMSNRWLVLSMVLLGVPFWGLILREGLGDDSLLGVLLVLGTWPLLAFVGVLAVFFRNRRDRARLTEIGRTIRARHRQVCRGCGYDLAGATENGQCPECGLGFEHFTNQTGSGPSHTESPADPPANPPGR